jgi:hypothetical protein
VSCLPTLLVKEEPLHELVKEEPLHEQVHIGSSTRGLLGALCTISAKVGCQKRNTFSFGSCCGNLAGVSRVRVGVLL